MKDEIKLFDSHCHLDMEEFRGDLGEVWRRAGEAGVRRVLLAACDEPSSGEAVRMAAGSNSFGVGIWASAGVHPHEADGVANGLPETLTSLSSRGEVVAIGEIGLDYYYDNSPRGIQRDVFEFQLDWAARVKKPILAHLRNARDRNDGDAYGEAMSMIKNFTGLAGGIIHCFSGDKADARAALDMGFFISFAGPLTYPKAEELRQVAAYAPLDRIFCETDSPYLAPQCRRGKRNEPALVREVYAKMAEVRNTAMDEIARVLWDNAGRLFMPNCVKTGL
ncbi:MAG: TatD family hydrolase [Synergistaceae bacterium]|jgi:TatD DNase family protein|nr:TatD family hydrolase [Synergistaceae bacterium]